MKNFIGHDGFIWWIGRVVDLNDPLSLGRCRVRIFGYHGEEKDIPDEDLPWAVAIHPINTPNFYGTPRIGYFVFGFFLLLVCPVVRFFLCFGFPLFVVLFLFLSIVRVLRKKGDIYVKDHQKNDKKTISSQFLQRDGAGCHGK